MKSARLLLTALLAVALAACSSAPKKETPELSKLLGKKVAVVEISGEQTSQKIVEVALVNQILKRGTFILVPKQDIDQAREAHDIQPGDLRAVAQRAGAEFSLQAEILEFNADTQQFYGKEKVRDSQLAAEQGGSGETERLYKLKQMNGAVKVQVKITDLATGEIRSGIAHAERKAEVKVPGHLPSKMSFLSSLTEEAFQRFFQDFE